VTVVSSLMDRLINKQQQQAKKKTNKQTKSHPAHPNQTQVMQTQIMKKKTRNVLFNVNCV
jgi:hypothetical protein